MSNRILWVVSIAAIMLCVCVPLASAGTYVLEDDKVMPFGLYVLFTALVVLAGYYSFTFEDSNSFTDTFCCAMCVLFSLLLMIFSFWGVQDAQGHIWKSGWIGIIWLIIMIYFAAVFVSNLLDIAKKEGDLVSY